MAATRTRLLPREFTSLERELSARREALLAHFAERRAEVLVEREPDDEGAEASRSFSREFTFSMLDRERQTLEEIEAAQKRLRVGDYGVCGTCGMQIPDARLQALPWTRVCIQCAERGTAA